MRFFVLGLFVATLFSCRAAVEVESPEDQTVLSNPPAFTADSIPLDLPYTEVEAESAPSSGTWPPLSRSLHTAAAEASGRRYVKLEPGQRVVFSAPVAGDSLVIRFSLPDAPAGDGESSELKIIAGGSTKFVPITSRYSWEYGIGNWGSSDVWNQAPSAGSPRHFWDEANVRTAAYQAGEEVVVANPADASLAVLIDLVDFEAIPAAVARPGGSVSFADYSPAADGKKDDSAKLRQAIADAGTGTVYIPEGTYKIGSIDVGSVTIQGAGLWRTRFVGANSRFHFTGGETHLADFAIFGETYTRNDGSDTENGLAGNPASGTTIERLWIEHKKCAFWMGVWNNTLGPSGITITECRFRNTMADAVNLCSGTKDTVVQDCLVRGTGDDGLAAWSPQIGDNPVGGNNQFLRNLVQQPWLASGISLYGGGPFVVDGNVVMDTVTTGSGIYVSANFSAWPFSGTTVVKNNTIIRGGANESDAGGPTGAIRVLASDKDMTGGTFTFTDNTVISPTASAVSIQGAKNAGTLSFDGLTVSNAPYIADVRSSAVGSAVFTNVTVSSGSSQWRNSAGSNFTLTHD